MDEVDFGSLYERHADGVFRFALYLTGNRAEAEDVTSETFVRAWMTREEIRVGTVKAYLLMIARNLCRTWRRTGVRAGQLDENTRDPRPGPEADAIALDQLSATLRRLQRLPEVDRAALLMRAEGELSYEAIAAALGLSVVAARVKVHRARLELGELREEARTP